MDIYEPFQNFQFDSFIFKTTRYKEYSQGKLLSEGYVDISILCKTQENNTIKVYLTNNSLSNKILSEFEFDILFSLEDRLQLTIFPNHTNVEDILFSYLKWTIPYTREYKEFIKNEPIVGHIFTESGNIIKITFKMTEPERIIEFY